MGKGKPGSFPILTGVPSGVLAASLPLTGMLFFSIITIRRLFIVKLEFITVSENQGSLNK